MGIAPFLVFCSFSAKGLLFFPAKGYWLTDARLSEGTGCL